MNLNYNKIRLVQFLHQFTKKEIDKSKEMSNIIIQIWLYLADIELIRIELSNFENENECIVALLHDVVEAPDITFEQLEKDFPPEVIQALKLLTHDKKLII